MLQFLRHDFALSVANALYLNLNLLSTFLVIRYKTRAVKFEITLCYVGNNLFWYFSLITICKYNIFYIFFIVIYKSQMKFGNSVVSTSDRVSAAINRLPVCDSKYHIIEFVLEFEWFKVLQWLFFQSYRIVTWNWNKKIAFQLKFDMRA